ncbi:hypothetical protein GCM10025864_17850 [Luteimicrobium album]|uniref:MFS transporter n=1 Tax=Luteimicrobium album TaxID=1054550 RepID=A0ABQ6HZY3_9MICO|nr:hypothetical protein GCM10025864_17850 [Luteimicrobium album]
MDLDVRGVPRVLVWVLWSIVVPQLAGAGFTLTVDQQFWLVSIPSLVGATLRIPYTFAVTAFGGRNWTIVSALLLLLPTTALAVVVQHPDTSFGVDEFPDVTIQLAFLGALVGSVARPFGGTLADRVGGTRVTIASYVVMALGALGAIGALHEHSFGLFFGSFLVLFVASGVGNGSIYRMIPAIFRADAEASVPDDGAAPARPALFDGARKAAAGCIGIAGAIGAFGGFLIPRGFAASTNHAGSLVPALWAFIGVYLVMGVVTWAVYQRPGSRLAARSI